jgi:hypothetical protein
VAFGLSLLIALAQATPSRAEAGRGAEPKRQWNVENERPPELAKEDAPEDRYMLAERPLRLGLEILVGGVAGGAVGGVFLLTASGLCKGTGLGNDEEDGCLAPALYSAATGFMLGLPLGVYLGGELWKGDGALGWTLMTGWALTGIGLAATVATNSPAVLAGSFAVVFTGSILAYELTSDRNIANARRRHGGVNVTPFVDWTRAGISVFGAF